MPKLNLPTDSDYGHSLVRLKQSSSTLGLMELWRDQAAVHEFEPSKTGLINTFKAERPVFKSVEDLEIKTTTQLVN